MKAIIYHSHDDIRLEEVPIPTISADELLVRVAGCGLCGSDVLKIKQRAPAPVKLGHELTGIIVEAGRDAVRRTGLDVGRRVVVAHHVPCGDCHYCRHGNVSMCSAFKTSNIDPGGFAEYIRVPAANAAQMTLPLPDEVSDEDGSFAEPLACIVRAVRRSALLPGDLAVVYGLGTMGVLMAQTLQAAGAQVVGVDVLPERLALAAALGVIALPADAIDLASRVRDLTDGRGADVALLTAGGASASAQAIDLLRPGGMLHIFASSPNNLATLDLNLLYHHELTVSATYATAPEDLRTALDLIATRKVRVDGIISHRLPLEAFDQAVDLFTSRQARKVYLSPQ